MKLSEQLATACDLALEINHTINFRLIDRIDVKDGKADALARAEQLLALLHDLRSENTQASENSQELIAESEPSETVAVLEQLNTTLSHLNCMHNTTAQDAEVRTIVLRINSIAEKFETDHFKK